MATYLNHLYEKKKDKKDMFEQIPLYVELNPPPSFEKEKKEEEEKSGVIIIELY
jgi:hypothetical protein